MIDILQLWIKNVFSKSCVNISRTSYLQYQCHNQKKFGDNVFSWGVWSTLLNTTKMLSIYIVSNIFCHFSCIKQPNLKNGLNFLRNVFVTSKLKMGKWWDQTFCVLKTPGLMAPAYVMLDLDSDSLAFDQALPYFYQKMLSKCKK